MNNDDRTIINAASMATGFTQSEITVHDACAEKWYRGYNQLLRKKGVFHWHNVYGSAMHSTLEDFYLNGAQGPYELAMLQIPNDVILTANDEERLQYYATLLRLQAERYALYYCQDATQMDIKALL